MMYCVSKFIFLCATLFPMIASRHVQFFRKDYVYIKEFNAFYKVHWDLNGISWSSAFLACDDEGTTLFYPNIKGEWALVKNLTSVMAEPPNVTDIFVGLHDEFGVGEFITIDGHSTPSPLGLEVSENNSRIPGEKSCVLMNIETGLYSIGSCINFPDSPLPFICKKVDNESCPTVDQGYKYNKLLKKCYKINKKPKMWDEAMRTCYMEGGILAVLENKENSEALFETLDGGLKYHVGFRRIFSQTDYYTVKGQKYDDRYIQDIDYGNHRDCGAVYLDRILSITTADCGTRLPFICEMEVNI